MHKYFIPLIGLIFYKEFDRVLMRANPRLVSRLLLSYGCVHACSLYALMYFIVLWTTYH